MPINRNTLLRYKTIDRMLRNGRRATLQELIDACNDALYEHNGYGEVSRRTVQHDIEEMRYSRELGYYAPIKVVDRKYYKYEDYDYSITDVPLSETDIRQLTEAVELLKQMSSFKGFSDVEDVVNRLEDHVASMRYKVEPVILLESNDRLRGLEHITPLHDAILEQTPVTIVYKSFQWNESQQFLFSPYILKEFRNRWFVFGRRHDAPEGLLLNLALDRIEDISDAPKRAKYIKIKSFHPQQYFKDIIGVSRFPDDKVVHIVFRVAAKEVPYVITKPLHQSQKEIERMEDGSTLFSIDVIPNYELERDILGYGEGITIIEPEELVCKIHKRLKSAFENYESAKPQDNTL
ncbi:MAG: WYL domain-containing protein [Prevotella sp.]|nr:WYL domain-containing protein [Prevotella sp.]